MLNECEKETQFPVRCTVELRNQAQELADKNGWSLVEWVRRAMREKIERDLSGNSILDSEKFQSAVDASVKKTLSELGFMSGTVHGLAFAEPDGKKFEKVMLKQKSY